jgi:acetyltransferase
MQVSLLGSRQFDGARGALIELLLDSVSHGASIGFLDDLTQAEAAAYWDGVTASVMRGERILWSAEHQGQLVGTVQLELCRRKNGVNRAEIQKLLVHSGARRLGIASALMQEVEQHARSLQRGLLYLDTEAGSPAEALYQALGYTTIGGLPEYACSPDGTWTANAIYYKTLFLRSTQ